MNTNMAYISALIDITPPQSGTVTDGDPDTVYSSDPATVEVAWSGFADPESGHSNVDWQIYRTHLGK